MSDDPQTPAEYEAFVARLVNHERTHLRTIQELQDACMAALADRKLTLTLELSTLVWIDIVAEIKDRIPRNYSQLLRDDMMDRLEDAIARLHDETNYMIASGPGSIAERHDPRRQATRRDIASPHLKKIMREKGQTP